MDILYLTFFLVMNLGEIWAKNVAKRDSGDKAFATLRGTVMLRCNADFFLDSDCSILWFNPRNTLISINSKIEISSPDNKYKITKPYSNGNILEINNINEEDEGEYICKFSKKSEEISSKSFLLTVSIPPKMISPIKEQVSIVEGDSLTLNCSSTGTPEPNMTWRFLNDSSHSRKILNMKDPSTYVLKNVTLAQAGQYECQADNGIRPTASSLYIVDIKAKPKLHLPYSRTYQKIDRYSFIQCIVTWNPVGTFHWEFQNVNIASDNIKKNNNNGFDKVKMAPFKLSQPSSSSSSSNPKYATLIHGIDAYTWGIGLFVYDFGFSDAGMYKCKVENEFGYSEGTIDVVAITHITDNNNIDDNNNNNHNNNHNKHQIREVDALLNDDVVLHCRHRNNKTASWWRRSNDMKLTEIPLTPSSSSSSSSSPKYQLMESRHLKIYNVNHNDRGYYICILENIKGGNDAGSGSGNGSGGGGGGGVVNGGVVGGNDGEKVNYTWYLSVTEMAPSTSCIEANKQVKLSTTLALLGGVVGALILLFGIVLFIVVSRHKKQLDMSRESVKDSICSRKRFEDL